VRARLVEPTRSLRNRERRLYRVDGKVTARADGCRIEGVSCAFAEPKAHHRDDDDDAELTNRVAGAGTGADHGPDAHAGRAGGAAASRPQRGRSAGAGPAPAGRVSHTLSLRPRSPSTVGSAPRTSRIRRHSVAGSSPGRSRSSNRIPGGSWSSPSTSGSHCPLPWKRRPQAALLLDALRRADRGFDAVVIGEPARAFYGNQFGLAFPVFAHYGVELGAPEVGGRVDPGSDAHDLVMSLYGGMSKGERNRIKVRVRSATVGQRPRGSHSPRSRSMAGIDLRP
jgi:hypothetical protein